MPLHEAITARIVEGYTQDKAIRKDAVRYLTHVLTGSHEEMKQIFSSKQSSAAWLKSNLDFLEKEYGKENILRFTLHLDEKTPHLHAVTVPLTKDGRLSAKEQIGNKTVMQQRQDRYAAAVQGMGLSRGERSTGVTHESARQYYSRIEDGLKSDQPIQIEKNLLGMVSEKSLTEAFSMVDKANTLVRELKAREKRNLAQIKQQSEQLEVSRKSLAGERVKNRQLLIDPERYQVQKGKLDKSLTSAIKHAGTYLAEPGKVNLARAARDTGVDTEDLKTFLTKNPKVLEEVKEHLQKLEEKQQQGKSQKKGISPGW